MSIFLDDDSLLCILISLCMGLNITVVFTTDDVLKETVRQNFVRAESHAVSTH